MSQPRARKEIKLVRLVDHRRIDHRVFSLVHLRSEEKSELRAHRHHHHHTLTILFSQKEIAFFLSIERDKSMEKYGSTTCSARERRNSSSSSSSIRYYIRSDSKVFSFTVFQTRVSRYYGANELRLVIKANVS